jgi:LmbE family N-acetylglucosaminyl deacetylase
MSDGFFKRNKKNLLKIVSVIRTYQPDIILANPLTDRHPDHGRAGKLVQDACFHAGLRKIEDGLEPRRPQAIYHYIQDRMLEADFVVDITNYKTKKDEVMMAYASQLFDPTSTEPQTAISGKDFLEYVTAQDRVYGRHI